MHGILVYNILNKCYNKNSSYNCYDIDKLGDEDKDILSHAALLNLLKTMYKDELGFVVYEFLLSNFNCSILPTKNRERYYITKAREKFNSYAVDFTRSVASGQIREILNDCEIKARNSQLKFLPTYASMYAVMDYIQREKLPIIIFMANYNRQNGGQAGVKYSFNHYFLRFYELQEDGNKFLFKKKLSNSETEMLTIVFRCFRFSENGAEEFSTDYDIRDLLMAFAANQTQLPKIAKLPAEYTDADEYARELYKKHTEIFNEYNNHYELAKKHNIIGACYSTASPNSVEPGGQTLTLTVERSERDVFFSLEHVYSSSYSCELLDLQTEEIDITAELDQCQVYNLDMNQLTRTVLEKFAIVQPSDQ